MTAGDMKSRINAPVTGPLMSGILNGNSPSVTIIILSGNQKYFDYL